MGLSGPEVDNLRLTLVSVEQGDVGILHSLGIKVHTVSMVHTVRSSVELTEFEAGFLYCYLLSVGGGTVVNC